MGRALLAHSSPADQDECLAGEMAAFTRFTITDGALPAAYTSGWTCLRGLTGEPSASRWRA
ncbi:hypothetical protein [Streptacidiphilus sp. MAP12-33]|uniref:hypothetical protein n=1 Tax=Streptacidiphilus sp. MAP12-33 TaxID=3156266 RepID=UPI003511A9B6